MLCIYLHVSINGSYWMLIYIWARILETKIALYRRPILVLRIRALLSEHVAYNKYYSCVRGILHNKAYVSFFVCLVDYDLVFH